MAKKMKLEDIIGGLDAGRIIPLPEKDWLDLAAAFPVKDVIPTSMAGEIHLVRRPLPGGGKKLGWALVEQSKPGEKVIRALKNEKEARALIADRLAAYERMWDG